jgi:hypothetical protein
MASKPAWPIWTRLKACRGTTHPASVVTHRNASSFSAVVADGDNRFVALI